MELLAVFGVCLAIAIPVGSILGLIAFHRSRQLERRVDRMSTAIDALQNTLYAAQTRERSESQENKGAALPKPVAAVPSPAPVAAVPAITTPAVPRIEPPSAPRQVIESTQTNDATPAQTPPTPSPTPVFEGGRPGGPFIGGAGLMPDHPIKSRDPDRFENLIGKRLTWVGLGILFLGLVFFAKFAWDKGWFGRVFPPPMRIAALLVAAAGMVVVGARLRANQLLSMGESLIGGGIGIAYLAIFAGLSPKLSIISEPLFSPTVAFLSMAGVTALGMTLSVMLNARTTAIIAVIGGFATPLLVSTGQNSRDALFIYLIILDLGVLAVAFYRQWRALDVLTFAGTALLFMGWFARYYDTYQYQPNWGTLAWLGLFHVLFLGVAFAYHWRTRTPLTLERFVLVLGNLAWTLGYSAWILQGRQKAEALICMVMALIYSLLGQRARRIDPRDERIFHAFTAIAIMLVTLAILFQLPTDTVAAGWFVEAAALLYLGYRWAYEPTRWCALVVLTAATIRTFATAEHHREAFAFALNSIFTKLIIVPAALAAFAIIHRSFSALSSDPERIVKYICGSLSGLILLGVLHFEIVECFRFSDVPQTRLDTGILLGFLWCAGAAGYLIFARWRRDRVAFAVAALPWSVAASISLWLYTCGIVKFDLFWNERFATAAVACAIAAAGSYIARTGQDLFLPSQKSRFTLTSAVQVVFFMFTSIEVIIWNLSYFGGGNEGARMTTWMLSLLWLSGGLICVRYGRAFGSMPSAGIGIAAIALATAGSFISYGWSWPSQLMYLNQRFALCLAVAGGLTLSALWIRCFAHLREDWRKLPAILGVASAAFLWLVLTIEPPSWFLTNLADHVRARRLATFSITLTWVVFASVMLAIGFLRRLRAARLTALTLFGATVVKILLVDMSGAQQLMRIASFIVTGVVLIAASYVYHRAEKYLESREKSDGSRIG
jgi:uncharacterized membrane protein